MLDLPDPFSPVIALKLLSLLAMSACQLRVIALLHVPVRNNGADRIRLVALDDVQ